MWSSILLQSTPSYIGQLLHEGRAEAAQQATQRKSLMGGTITFDARVDLGTGTTSHLYRSAVLIQKFPHSKLSP